MLIVLLGCSPTPVSVDAGSDAPRSDASTVDATTVDSGVTIDAPAPDAFAPPDAPSGADGDFCTTAAECRTPAMGTLSSCNTENGANYCMSFCTAPEPVTDGGTIAQGDCPEGSLCLPTHASDTVGFCLRACSADTDCRAAEGYYCRHRFLSPNWTGPVVTSVNGVCAPAHCQSRGCDGADCGC